jgi:hypothetical protein
MSPALFLSFGIAAVLLLEGAMWMLFRKRIEGIHFPQSADASELRFFTIRRIGICAVAHALFLMACLVLFFLLA